MAEDNRIQSIYERAQQYRAEAARFRQEAARPPAYYRERLLEIGEVFDRLASICEQEAELIAQFRSNGAEPPDPDGRVQASFFRYEK